MSSHPSVHDQTTIGTTGTSGTPGTTDYATSSTTQNYSSVPKESTIAQNDTTGTSAPIAHDRLHSEYESTTSVSQSTAPLASTAGPFQVPTTDDIEKKDAPPASSVGTHNAPGRPGELGEKALGGMGFGGTQVERPKEDQGLGEKIIAFLGA